MHKVCTNCENGVYDYSKNQLFCKGTPKTDNAACNNWEKKISTCRILANAWSTFKKEGRWL